MYKYQISFKIKQRQNRSLQLPLPLRISNIDLSEREGDLRGSIILNEESDEKALLAARYNSRYLTYALLLSTDNGFDLEEPVIESRTLVGEQKIIVETFARISSFAMIQLTLGKDDEKRLSDYMNLLIQAQQQKRNYPFRTLRWYNKAILEDDATDKFIDLYIALEILGEYYYPKASLSEEVKNIIDKLGKKKFDSTKIVGIRGAIIHSGEKEEEVKEYLNYLSTIVKEGIIELIGITQP